MECRRSNYSVLSENEHNRHFFEPLIIQAYLMSNLSKNDLFSIIFTIDQRIFNYEFHRNFMTAQLRFLFPLRLETFLVDMVSQIETCAIV